MQYSNHLEKLQLFVEVVLECVYGVSLFSIPSDRTISYSGNMKCPSGVLAIVEISTIFSEENDICLLKVLKPSNFPEIVIIASSTSCPGITENVFSSIFSYGNGESMLYSIPSKGELIIIVKGLPIRTFSGIGSTSKDMVFVKESICF